MDHIGVRIKAVMKQSGLTQVKFAERLHVAQSHISGLCKGASAPSDRTISDICREFRVDEHWLRTGEGEMLPSLSREEEISALVGDILTCDDDFKRRFISVLVRMDDDQWAALHKVVDALVEEEQKKA